MDPTEQETVRNSSSGSASGRPSRDNRKNSQQSLSLIEKSVTHLLVATKQLLETLTQWSRKQATEGEVSDIYVRLGYEFNIACRNFAAIGVDTSDLGPVPELLRSILEETLSQEASQQSLEKFLPRIRDIIINLLQGLKRKQQKLRLKTGKDGSSTEAARQSSVGSNGSIEGSPVRQSSASTAAPRQDGLDWQAPEGAGLPPRTSSANSRTSPTRQDSTLSATAPEQYSYSTSTPLLSGNVMQDYPSVSPYAEPERMASVPDVKAPNGAPPAELATTYLQPKQQDALAQLQRGGDLERRASRRFSAYQIQKHLGASSPGISMIPPTQTSPIPNRGRDNTRETMNAVRVRGSQGSVRERQRRMGTLETSPNRQKSFPQGIPEEKDVTSDVPSLGPLPQYAPLDDSPMKTPEDKLRPAQSTWTTYRSPSPSQDEQNAKGDLDGATSAASADQTTPGRSSDVATSDDAVKPPTSTTTSSSSRALQPNTKELTLYLQYKTKIKKFVLTDGYDELSVARLQLAFIEKFAWNVHSSTADLPDIYIQDPVSGVRYELEDLNDVKNNSVLALNVDGVDEVKRHFDDSLGSLRSVVEGVKTAVDGQHSAIQRISDKQIDLSKEAARASSVGSARKPPEIFINGERGFLRSSTSQLSEVQSLRRDLAVMRQTYQNLMSDMEASMSKVREKATVVKDAARDASNDSFGGESGRGYVNTGKKTLSEDSEKIINRVDDLQDLVEDLRKDVVSRGVRPLPRQLESVSKEITTATAELKKLQSFMKREKPTWTKIWKNELQVVCDDQNLLTMQEELAADLEDDLEKAAQTFALVEQATKQQNLQQSDGPLANATRSTSRTLNVGGSEVDAQKAKDGVLGEVRALQPNHETRLEAIERAEKNRQRELQDRTDGAFKKELGNFVDEGKLKKSGGVEEAERQRKTKDELIRRGIWEKVGSRSASREPEPGKGQTDASGAEQGQSVAAIAAAIGADDNKGDSDVPHRLDVAVKSDGGDARSPDEFVEAPEQFPPTEGMSATLF